jgi:hypothetical protein
VPHAVQTLVRIRDLIFSIQHGGNTHFSRGEILISARWKYSRTARPIAGLSFRSETAPGGGWAGPSFLQRPQQLPDDCKLQDYQHGVGGPAADPVHSRTSYSNATPSGSFSSNHFSAASRDSIPGQKPGQVGLAPLLNPVHESRNIGCSLFTSAAILAV